MTTYWPQGKKPTVEYDRIDAENWSDENGMPTGGTVLGTGIDIMWQAGPLGRGVDRKEPNGAFVEDVILGALQRIQYYNSTEFRCRENSLAITKLEEALHWLHHRQLDRETRGVQGTHEL